MTTSSKRKTQCLGVNGSLRTPKKFARALRERYPGGLHNKFTILLCSNICLSILREQVYQILYTGRVRPGWTIVRVAATKLLSAWGGQMCTSCKQLRLFVQEIQMYMSCKPLGLHNKFTNLCKSHKFWKNLTRIFVYFAN